MSENKQDQQQTEVAEKDVADNSAEQVSVDAVAEQRPAKKTGGGVVGLLMIIVLLGVAAGAAWYYQPMWPAPMKEWVADVLPKDEAVDLMAAPEPNGQQPDATENESPETYVLAAIPDEKPAGQEQQVDVADSDVVKEQPAVEEAVAIPSEPVAEPETVAPVEKEQVAVTEAPAESPEVIAAISEQATATEQADVTESTDSPIAVTANLDAQQTAEPVTEEISEAEPVVSEAEAVAVNEEQVAAVEQDVAPETAIMEPVAEAMEVGTTEAAKPEMAKTEESTGETAPGPAVTLQQARAAFWSHDLVRAEGLYLQLTLADAANTDAWGELGNIYYLQAKWRQAAQAYTQAALQLIDKGDFRQAMFLQFIVRGLDHPSAMRIHERFRALQAPVR